MAFNDRLKSARKSKGYTQESIADLLGLERTRYVKWENGKSRPSYEAIFQICDLLGVSSDYLLGLTDDPAPRRASQETVQAAIDGVPEVTSEQVAAALPEEYREAVIALIRAELHKQG